jgi:hypothetical protein
MVKIKVNFHDEEDLCPYHSCKTPRKQYVRSLWKDKEITGRFLLNGREIYAKIMCIKNVFFDTIYSNKKFPPKF